MRPGGSALNAGQVGGLRAAQYITAHEPEPIDLPERLTLVRDQIVEEFNTLKDHLAAGSRAPSVAEVRREIQQRMSEHAAFVRTPEGARAALAEARKLAKRIKQGMRVEAG